MQYLFTTTLPALLYKLINYNIFEHRVFIKAILLFNKNHSDLMLLKIKRIHKTTFILQLFVIIFALELTDKKVRTLYTSR